MAEELEQKLDDDVIEDDESSELEEFDPASLPLGTFASFDVSDEPLFTTKNSEAEYELNEDQMAAFKTMLDAAARADLIGRRTEVQGAWLLELLDRGFHRVLPNSDGGWRIYGSFGAQASRGIYGAQSAQNYHDTNVFGDKADIITSCLVREIAECTFFPNRPGNPDDEVYAAAANNLKHFICEENKYGDRQAEVARFFCTDETAIAYTRPVADAQQWGYEDSVPEVVPEVTDGDTGAQTEDSTQPKIRTIVTIFGKLNRKVPVQARSMADWQYCLISEEWDIARAKATFPWVEEKINAGDLGAAEIKLDRLARQSINLALQSQFAVGDSMQRDCTVTRAWFRPGFYMDASCPKPLRSWFWKNFPKGCHVVYAGETLCFARNEGMDEVLTEMHAHTGNGQNRRALMESFAGPQQRLNVLVDLRDEFCRKTIPRVGLDPQVWNVAALRASSVRVGVYEPAMNSPVAGQALGNSIAEFPVATGSSDITPFIEWISGPLAEQLTHAQPALSASETNDPETLGQSQLQNANALSAFGESWKAILHGFARITTQAVAWNARVQPEDKVFDSENPNAGRIQAKIADLKMGSGVARPDGTANYPSSWNDRQAAWMMALQKSDDPLIAGVLSDPRTMAALKEFLPHGAYLPGVDAVEKQNSEFDVLLKSTPIDNPQFLKLKQLVDQGTQMAAQRGQQADPAVQQKLQQAQRMLQSMPPLISSVPVRGDGSENDSVEALICLGKMNSPEGRRLAISQDPKDQQAFQNLHLHWTQHTASAQKNAPVQPPIPPKTSISVDASKLPPQEQAEALQKMGVGGATPESIQQNQQAPHEMSVTEKGVSPSGSEIERKESIAGKPLR